MAKVWAGKADLPCTAELWRRYDKVVKDRGGYGKHFQDLSFEEAKSKFHFRSLSFDSFWHIASAVAMRFFQGWLNADAVKYGGRQVCSI